MSKRVRFLLVMLLILLPTIPIYFYIKYAYPSLHAWISVIAQTYVLYLAFRYAYSEF